MTISDFDSTQNVETTDELRAVLAKRFEVDGALVNSFWIALGSAFPLMCIVVKDDLANVWYSDSEDSPGANSVGSVQGLPDGGGTRFYLDEERHWVPNESIITVSDAILAAEEFLLTGTRPKSLRWLDL
jgi:hypothetical protein